MNIYFKETLHGDTIVLKVILLINNLYLNIFAWNKKFDLPLTVYKYLD